MTIYEILRDSKKWMIASLALLILAGANPSHASASNTTDPLSRWCADTIRLLDSIRRDADYAYYRGDFQGAKLRLLDGLARAQQNDPFRANGPLTARAVSRGIALGAAVDASQAQESNGARTTVYFLFRYYDFISFVANDLDYPFYIPFRHCGGCRMAEEAVFEERFVQYTNRQVALVLETLADRVSRGNFGGVVPVGNAPAFLKALELAAGFASNDLRESIWAPSYACAVGDLLNLSDTLRTYNQTGVGFYDDFDAVNRSYESAESVVWEIDHSNGCRGWRR